LLKSLGYDFRSIPSIIKHNYKFQRSLVLFKHPLTADARIFFKEGCKAKALKIVSKFMNKAIPEVDLADFMISRINMQK
jgi:hypothetical protein